LPDPLTPPHKAKVRLGGGWDKLHAGPIALPRHLQSRRYLPFFRISLQTELIDRIYECAVVPELWPDVTSMGLSALLLGQGGTVVEANS
jgi:hypothetical protein